MLGHTSMFYCAKIPRIALLLDKLILVPLRCMKYEHGAVDYNLRRMRNRSLHLTQYNNRKPKRYLSVKPKKKPKQCLRENLTINVKNHVGLT